MKICDIEVRHGLILAPMAGVTDCSFRTLCAEMGAEITVSEMISAKGVYYNDKKTVALAASSPIEKNFSLQIFGSEPEIMASSAKRLREINPAIRMIDINMGCPMPKITGNGEGSALMRDPELAGRVVRAVSESCGLSVSVKMRTGWDSVSINAPELAKICEHNGASLICVHGRTREQLYRPPVDYETIRRVKEAVTIPVVANGGICCAEDALRVLELTGCDGVAIGQAAFGNPWIFREILCAFEGRCYIPPERSEVLDLAKRHIGLLCADKGEYIGVRESRKHLGWYVKGMPGAAEARGKINSAVSVSELFEILDSIR